jgi:cell division protein FtsW
MKPNKSPLFFLVSSLIAIGIIFISISSLTEGNSTIGDKFFFFRKQSFWLLISLVAFYVASKIKIEIIQKFSSIFYLFSILGLILVLAPGLSNQALGARRWLNLGLLSFQPSEILKLSSIIFFASHFSKEKFLNFKNLIFYLAGPFLLIILEPNLSTAILVTAIVISLFYLAGGKILPLFGLCVAIVGLSLILVITSPYRAARLKTLLNPESNTESTSYHSNQIILSLSSGGFFGKGFANSDQKYKFLPKISTDSILAIIGEETGFLGVSIILIIYISLICYLFKISSLVDNKFQSLLVAGTACWISYQCLINLAAVAAIIPLTGVPLPFISYGGSSLVTLLTSIGLVRNVEKNNSLLLYSDNDSKVKQNNPHHRNPSHSRT